MVALLPRVDLCLRAPLVARRWREVLQDRRVWAHLPPLLRLPDNLLLQVNPGVGGWLLARLHQCDSIL